MRLYFSWRISLVCGLLALLMLRASYWQWQRYLEKTAYIETLRQRLELPQSDLTALASSPDVNWELLIHRKVLVNGRFDFQHEMALRNRRYGETAGVHLITPLEIDAAGDGSVKKYVLVNRGFVPLSKADRDVRKQYHVNAQVSFTGLVKQSMHRILFAPSDPPSGADHPWVDQWLRVDIAAMQKQLPYQVLPVYLEIMQIQDREAVEEKMLASKSGKDELLFLGAKGMEVSTVGKEPDLPYPMPVFDTVIPPGRHFGYIFEWAAMALMTIVIGLVLQLKRSKSMAVR